MKQIFARLLLTISLFGLLATTRAQSYSGMFLTGNGVGFIGGSFQVTLEGGQAHFQSTWFQLWTAGTSLEPTWEIAGSQIQFELGNGTPGTWALGEFFGPGPGFIPFPPDEHPIDPGFNLPIYEDGVRYSGSFSVPTEFEDALANGPGIVRMQIHGTVNVGGSSMQDPLFTAVLLAVPEPSTGVLLTASGAALLYRKRIRA